jgi:uncharacterized membrane protein YtjA (UPF0391 family)
MLKWALIFLVLGLIAGALGFTTVAGASYAIAKILFFLFAAIFVLFIVLGATAAKKISR